MHFPLLLSSHVIAPSSFLLELRIATNFVSTAGMGEWRVAPLCGGGGAGGVC